MVIDISLQYLRIVASSYVQKVSLKMTMGSAFVGYKPFCVGWGLSVRMNALCSIFCLKWLHYKRVAIIYQLTPSVKSITEDTFQLLKIKMIWHALRSCLLTCLAIVYVRTHSYNIIITIINPHIWTFALAISWMNWTYDPQAVGTSTTLTLL